MAHSISTLESCVSNLFDNEQGVYEKASETLLRIFTDIEDNHTVEKYRKIKISSDTVCENLLPANGGIECLMESGFVKDESGEYLILPMEADLKKIQTIRRQIQSRCDSKAKKEANAVVDQPPAVPSQPTSTASTRTSDSKWPKWRFPSLPANIALQEARFFVKMKMFFEHVLIYESNELQQKARECIPRKLLENALHKFNKSEISKFGLSDFYIVELLDWYKETFFRWINSPDCEYCQGKTKVFGMGEPTQDDRRWGAGRVELYKCTVCAKTTRFPRYNHPGKLLETRRGRCGEWANCFTLICRASGYEAKHVVDWTDHVWTEVFSNSQQRWLHCDPCENVLDKPLLYEAGWGKEITYVIAFSRDDINDVSWRYSADHQALVLRRVQCREDWLVKAIKALREERQRGLSEVIRRVHQLRLIKEGAEFISSERKPLSAGEMIGRLTGSQEWRDARGESGSGVVTATHHSFTPNAEELKLGCMEVKYCCSTNSYTQSGGKEDKHDWKTCIYESRNMQRHVELDWHMNYLARTTGSDNSSILWHFDLSNHTIDQVTVYVSSATFHSGSIVWTAEDNQGNNIVITPDTSQSLDSLKGAKWMRLTAELSAGDGRDAWRHTQLFRQNRDDKQSMMSVKIMFSN